VTKSIVDKNLVMYSWRVTEARATEKNPQSNLRVFLLLVKEWAAPLNHLFLKPAGHLGETPFTFLVTFPFTQIKLWIRTLCLAVSLLTLSCMALISAFALAAALSAAATASATVFATAASAR
jgi:hypothetical protein